MPKIKLFNSKKGLLSFTFVRQTSENSDYPLLAKILSRQANQICHNLANAYGSSRKMEHHKTRSSPQHNLQSGLGTHAGLRKRVKHLTYSHWDFEL